MSLTRGANMPPLALGTRQKPPAATGCGLTSGPVTIVGTLTGVNRQHAGRVRPYGAALATVGFLLAGCGSSLIGPASTTPTSSAAPVSSTSTTGVSGSVGVAFPVVDCTSSSGASLGDEGWKPTVLLAPIPTTLVGKVEFYSDGVHTVLGPVGWACAQTPGTAGATGLVVSPPGVPNASESIPAAGQQGIFAIFDNTGQAQGIALVCPFFTVPKWQQTEAKCTGVKPTGEQSSLPTPDVASVTDPAGAAGSLEGSGGSQPVTGTVIFPQVLPEVTYGSPVQIAVESCSLTDASLCPTILADFDVREFPVPLTESRS